MRSNKLAAAVLFIAGCILFLGCSRSKTFTMAPVRGHLTYHGKPLSGATVTFLCPGAPRLALGTTDEAGNFQLTTFEPNDGAIVGSHVITVNVYVSVPDADIFGDAKGKPQSNAIEDAMRKTLQQSKKAETAKPAIPSKYAERRTSDLHKDVVAGDNIINIELSD